MGTHVEIDEALLREAMAATGLTSGPATVAEALRYVIENRKLRAALGEISGIGWEGDLDAMRLDHVSDRT